MANLFSFLYDAVREDLGVPAVLLQLLRERPFLQVVLPDPTRVIAANSIPRWHEWGEARCNEWSRDEAGTVMGWRYTKHHRYDSFKVRLSEITRFGHCETITEWQCDIQDVVGLAASKSELTAFSLLDDMVETNSPEMIDTITEEKLQQNLAHDEIRIISRSSTSDHFVRHLWDARTFLINSGGSHHFAAARYIASRLRRQVPLKGKLHIYSIDPVSLSSLLGDFEVFAIPDRAAGMKFHDAMRSFRATYLWYPLPQPYQAERAILLPRRERRSMRVAKALREANVLDLGGYLNGLVECQHRTSTQ